MGKDNAKKLRFIVQLSAVFALIIIIILYNLYINEILDQRILGITDLNPYGGWSALKEYMTDSNYEYEGINKSIGLTLAILAISIIGGRFLCGWLCPLGALQDLGAWLRIKLNLPILKTINKGHNPLFLKYPILLSLLIISIFGYGAVIAELSPWRALLNLPRLFSAILVPIFFASMIIPRFFCRYLCPLGAVQTLFSTLSPLTIKVSKSCIGCNRCLKNCPMGIKLSAKEDTISPECIRCMNCIDNCKITKDKSLTLQAGNRVIKTKTYALIMLSLFFSLWFILPKSSSEIGGNIPIANLKDGTYQGEAKGFAARIVTQVKIKDGQLAEINVISHHESKGWYEEVFMVVPREVIRKQKLQVDGISGATKTSKGLIKSIESALQKAK
ncbi:MAG: 4Fe-4S binding protein [Lutispora sp.]|nr:4Fe-4S binding protein [Lutispora sp.]MDD4834076.1 4Fe-4S binding protein [Lutispora sp.]